MRRMFIVLVIVLFTSVAGAQEAPPSLLAAVQRYTHRDQVDHLSFRFGLVDLNSDGLDDAVVLLNGPEWCGSGGCNMLVFRGTARGFSFLSSSTITVAPILVCSEAPHGWRTLIVSSNGVGEVLMRFNGSRYPLNPSRQPKATPAQVRAARAIIPSSHQLRP